uniref:Uncharacterized protein n=1 Tax=Fundulus heteroclitus TaxID=8078 RepID=A0A3Q2QX96_FUNHE
RAPLNGGLSASTFLILQFLSLCVSPQTKLNELEDRVRRGAAERGEAEMKKKAFQEQIGQLNRQNEDLRKLQKELQSCKADTSVLNNKLTVDM